MVLLPSQSFGHQICTKLKPMAGVGIEVDPSRSLQLVQEQNKHTKINQKVV